MMLKSGFHGHFLVVKSLDNETKEHEKIITGALEAALQYKNKAR